MSVEVSHPPPAIATVPQGRSRRDRRVAAAALLVILITGVWLRGAWLGKLSFWADEFPHVAAGRALFDEGRPLLPSGREYRRALAQTVVVGASMRAFGEGEAQGRLPSVIVGSVSLLLIYWATRRRFGEIVAIASTAALAFMPLHVAHSRSARFYVAFALAYGVAALFGSRFLRTGRLRHGAVALLAFLLAFHLQKIAILLVVPLLVDAAILYAASSGDERKRLARLLGGTIALGAVAVVGLALSPGLRAEALDLVRSPVPGVDLDPAPRLNTLGRLLAQVQPFAWIVLAVPAVIGVRRAGRDGATLVVHALLPALLLSVLYRRVGEGLSPAINARYLLHLTPALAVVVGLAAREIVGLLRRRPASVMVVAAAIVGTAVVFDGPARVLPTTGHPGAVIHRPNWRAAAAVVEADWRSGDVLLSTDPLATSWYLGRCGTWLRTVERSAPFVDGGRDYYCGTDVAADLDATQRFIAEHPSGWVIAHPGGIRFVAADVRDFISGELERVPVTDDSVFVFRWGPSGSPSLR